jgi:biotin-(acetyl-CoA carboxylase) ligase
MGVNIGNNNVFKGNINIGENAKQLAKSFYQEFNSMEKLLELLKNDIVENYHESNKEAILQEYDEFKNEMVKPIEQRNNGFIISKLNVLNTVFSILGNGSSIAALIFTIVHTLHP